MDLIQYHQLISRELFDTEGAWPQYNLLLSDILDLSREYNLNGKNVLSIERNLLYGELQIWRPFFDQANFTSIESTPTGCRTRGAYNKERVSNHLIFEYLNSFSSNKRLIIEDIGDQFRSQIDLIIIPNLVHHISNQDSLWNIVRHCLKSSAKLYVFEPILRELHQYPFDYIRYTPSGLSEVLKRHGFSVEKTQTEGSPFEAVLYSYHQALQYLPKEIRDSEQLKYNSLKPLFRNYSRLYKDNLVRDNTSFPQVFSIIATNN